MRIINFINIATVLCMLTFGVSCTKDNSVIESSDELITLDVPAMPEFSDDAQSRIVFADDGKRPSVSWKEGDLIHIGSIKEIPDNTTLKEMIVDGSFATFRCVTIDEEDGTATFIGTNIPENADIAIYSMHPENVTKVTAKSGGISTPALDAFGAAVSPKKDDCFQHLSENDFLVAGFDSQSKSFKLGTEGTLNENKSFARVFSIGKFVLKLPDGTSGNLGHFKSDPTDKDNGVFSLSPNGRILPYIPHKNTGLCTPSELYGKLDIDCSNLQIEEIDGKKTVIFYSFIGYSNNTKDKTLGFSLQVGDKTYKKSIKGKGSIFTNKAIQFNLSLEEN